MTPETDAEIEARIATITDLAAVREELKRLAKAVRDVRREVWRIDRADPQARIDTTPQTSGVRV